eukprot:Gb_10784 [translate_table: standard]
MDSFEYALKNSLLISMDDKQDFQRHDGQQIHRHHHTMRIEGVKELGESVLVRKLHHMNINSSHHSKSENEPLFHGESITSSDSPQLIHTYSHTMHEEEILQTAPHHTSNINISDGNDDGNEGKFIGGGDNDFSQPLRVQVKDVKDSKTIYRDVRTRSDVSARRGGLIMMSTRNAVGRSTNLKGVVLARKIDKGSGETHY